MENKGIRLEETLNKIVIMFLYIFLLVDVVNGFLLRSNIINFVSLSQTFKLLMMSIMIYLIINNTIQSVKTLYIIGFIIILILLGVLFFIFNNLEQIMDLFRFSLLPVTFLYGNLYLRDKGVVNRIIILNFFYVITNIVLGILGFGFPQYQAGSIGTRGFFYAGNDLSMVFLLLSFYVLFLLWNYYKKTFFLIISLFLMYLGINLATKSSIFGIFIIIIYFPLKSIKWSKRGIIKTLLLTFSLLIITIFFLQLTVLDDLTKRTISALNRYDNNIISTILSGRDIKLSNIYQQYKENFSIYYLLFGVKNRVVIEMELFDFYFNYGLLGIFVFFGVLFFIFKNSALKFAKSSFAKDLFYINSLVLLLSFLSGHVFLSASVNIFISLLNIKVLYEDDYREIDRKRIFLISNMYPSANNPYFGVFVKNTETLLIERGYITSQKAVIDKTNLRLTQKIREYFIFYFNILYLGLKVNKYDIIYAHFITHSSIPLVLLKLMVDKPLILNTHGSDVLVKGRLAKIFSLISKFSIKLANLIIVPSEFFRQIVIDKFNISPEKILVFPSGGVDCKIFKPKKRTIKDQYVLGYVSRIEKGKGWDIFISIMDKIVEKYPNINVKGIMIGAGTDKEKCINTIKQYNLEKHIQCIGGLSQEKLRDYYNSFDLLIFPTRLEESLGLVGLEAMACKTPVIASNLGGIRTYVKNDFNGFLINVENIDGFVEAIYKYLTLSNEEKEEISNNAYITALKYERNKVIEQLVDKIKEL